MAESQNVGIISLNSALRVSGQDAQRFLNGMLTNDLHRAFEEAPSCGRTFLLTAKGKVISEILFYCENKTEALLIVSQAEAASVREALDKYLIADKVEISQPEPIEVLSLFESEFGPFARIKNRNPAGQEKFFKVLAHESTLILPSGILSDTHVNILRPTNVPYRPLSDEEIFALYYRAGQPRWGIDLLPDDFFLEFPLADSVSFDKGCYIGQETVARGTFRGKVNKVFSRIEGSVNRGELANSAGEIIGRVRSVVGNHALGEVKISALGLEMPFKAEPLVNETTFRGGR